MIRVAFDLQTGEITGYGTKKQAKVGEGIVEVDFEPDPYKHIVAAFSDSPVASPEVVSYAVVERDVPLENPADIYIQNREEDHGVIMSDAYMRALLERRPSEVFQWVEANVNDMAAAKEMIKRLAAAVSWLLKK